MTNSPGPSFDGDAPLADVVEQQTPVSYNDDDDGLESTRTVISRDADAAEADLIEQAMDVPAVADEDEFDR
jgi:hypothetical protein